MFRRRRDVNRSLRRQHQHGDEQQHDDSADLGITMIPSYPHPARMFDIF